MIDIIFNSVHACKVEKFSQNLFDWQLFWIYFKSEVQRKYQSKPNVCNFEKQEWIQWSQDGLNAYKKKKNTSGQEVHHQELICLGAK